MIKLLGENNDLWKKVWCMRTAFKHNPPIPYSLHDMRINELKIINDKILFVFENGYVKLSAPYPHVNGTVTIEGVDFDFVSVQLYNNNGEYGKYQGEKLALTDFLKKYDWTSFEVVDELYGYNQVLYSGYLSVKGNDNFIGMDISIYFTGNIVYETED